MRGEWHAECIRWILTEPSAPQSPRTQKARFRCSSACETYDITMMYALLVHPSRRLLGVGGTVVQSEGGCTTGLGPTVASQTPSVSPVLGLTRALGTSFCCDHLQVCFVDTSTTACWMLLLLLRALVVIQRVHHRHTADEAEPLERKAGAAAGRRASPRRSAAPSRPAPHSRTYKSILKMGRSCKGQRSDSR